MTQKIDTPFIKTSTRRAVLRYLRQAPCSRAELARRTGLTRAALSLIADELIADGVLREAPGVRSAGRGRTPIMLELCPDAYYTVGIDINRKRCKIGICNFSGQIVVAEQMNMDLPNAGQILEKIAAQVETLLTKKRISKQKVLGVGVATPGPVDMEKGLVCNPPNFFQWHNLPICEILSQKLQLPVYLENDACAIAMHNFLDNPIPDNTDFLLLLLEEDGIGSGVFSGGQLLRTADGFSCELGHISIDYRGKPCACGNRGCLELYAAGNRLLEQFPECKSWEALVQNAQAKEQAAQYLAAAIVSFCNLVKVKRVLLAGGIDGFGEALIPYLSPLLSGRSLAQSHIALSPALRQKDGSVAAASNVVICRYLDIC